ncbi:MerR family transcriptional regulator [Sporolactobacillus pectinivorans]|uniref:MerR family transcriptional regulator n=1 Tax=Sporolactobacillus pectinivorans TaxID=1591408 RepID=UPI000C25B237|nr:MerR family transcriptional regulator [Sporolactobacillus pectinivorans]
MNYTVKQLSELAGVSPRTLRFYDKMNLLRPDRINSSGYRIYGTKQVDLLQQILFFRELGFSLKDIRQIIYADTFDIVHALTGQYNKLLAEKERLNRLIATVEKTLASKKGEIAMSDHEKFEGFKKDMIDANEKKYGKEIREKYGKENVEQSYKKFDSLSQEDYEQSVKIQEEMFSELKKALLDGSDPQSAAAQKAADLHRQWLSYFWASYSKEAHAGLAEMYVSDPRFTAYYDIGAGKNAAKLLRDAIAIYTGLSKS